MRDIKFRGKRKDNGEWAYGDLITKPVHHECVILENGVINHSVDPATVGQFTGLKDKNGNEIYEGDILKRTQQIDGNWIDRIFEKYAVAYNSAIAGFEFKPMDGVEYKQYTVRPFGGEELEIIGNIHDVNPASGQAGVNNMFDPNQQQQESANEAAVAEANAQESAAQDQAMEVDSEEGTIEG